MLLQFIGTKQPTSDWEKSYKAWKHYPRALLHYHHACILEWDRRGFKPLFTQIRTAEQAYDVGIPETAIAPYFDTPTWIGWEKLHASHRGSLATKQAYYRELWNDKPGLEMVWPGDRPEPGEFLIHGRLTALVIELHKWHFEYLSKGQYGKMSYVEVERGRWVKDHLPLHERYAMEFGTAQFIGGSVSVLDESGRKL